MGDFLFVSEVFGSVVPWALIPGQSRDFHEDQSKNLSTFKAIVLVAGHFGFLHKAIEWDKKNESIDQCH